MVKEKRLKKQGAKNSINNPKKKTKNVNYQLANPSFIMTTIENRTKYIPAKIKLNSNNDLFIEKLNKNVKVRTMTESVTLTKLNTDSNRAAPKRYITKCFIKPIITPIWYSESLLLQIGSTKRKHEEKIYFQHKLKPYKWSERMTTEIKTNPKCIISEQVFPVGDYRDATCWISLENQQLASTDL